jgi:hypothetical protein
VILPKARINLSCVKELLMCYLLLQQYLILPQLPIFPKSVINRARKDAALTILTSAVTEALPAHSKSFVILTALISNYSQNLPIHFHPSLTTKYHTP